MKTTPKTTGLYYYHLTRMNYYPAAKPPDILDDIAIVDALHQQVTIEWVPIAGEPAAKIAVFDDSWKCLQAFAGVIPDLVALAAKGFVEPADVCRILDAHGIEDLSDKPLDA